MLPAVDEDVLRNNPDFAHLYHTLTTAILNPDGSTKNELIQKERDSVHENLKQHRLTHARHHLLSRAIATATPPEPKTTRGTIARLTRPRAEQTEKSRARPPTHEQSQEQDIPDPLLDLIFLLPPLLESSRPLDAESTTLLLNSPPFSELPTLLPQLAPLVSSSLRDSATGLARVANPKSNPSYAHRGVSSLAEHAVALRRDVRELKDGLAKARVETCREHAALLDKQGRAAGLLVRSLEGKHGVAARSAELRAAEVALLARKGELDARAAEASLRNQVYSPEAVAALRNYSAHLRDATLRVEEGIKAREMELQAYGVGVEGAEAREARMREMARAWSEMEKEIEEVRRDLDRLGT